MIKNYNELINKPRILGFISENGLAFGHHNHIYDENNNEIGYVTSNTYAHCIEKYLGYGFIDRKYKEGQTAYIHTNDGSFSRVILSEHSFLKNYKNQINKNYESYINKRKL